MQKKLFYIPSRNKVGAILRTTDEPKRYPTIKKAIDNLLAVDLIQLIHVMIYHPDEEGQIRSLLIKDFGKEKKRIQIESIHSGNFYDDLLNYAISEQTRRGVDYSLSLSVEAYPYITANNIRKMLEAASVGAMAIGLNIKEYENITKFGYISNAFSLYRNSVVNFTDTWGMFCLINDKEKNDKNFGIEEMLVVKHLIEKFGYSSIAIINPVEGMLVEPEDEELKKIREKVIKTKEERFFNMCKVLKIDYEELAKNIIQR